MKKLTSRLLITILILSILCVPVSAAELVPGGQILGISLSEGSLTVVSIHSELGKGALSAGLQKGDRILSINGQTVRSVDQVRTLMNSCQDSVQLQILRSGKPQQLQLTPTATSEGPKLGLYLKEGITGIGTVTYYDPANGTYGALGHGVNNKEGTLIPMKQGTAFPAAIVTTHKGICGKPGQLVGSLASDTPIGTVAKNTAQGIFGTLSAPDTQTLPTGKAKAGSATIRSTINENGVQEYSVEILRIYPNSRKDGRNMLIQITDDRLLDTTGGIVQGMSGSPIIQDGKLVGAVTHVLVNDPTTGYGIFIENMLDAAA